MLELSVVADLEEVALCIATGTQPCAQESVAGASGSESIRKKKLEQYYI